MSEADTPCARRWGSVPPPRVRPSRLPRSPPAAGGGKKRSGGKVVGSPITTPTTAAASPSKLSRYDLAFRERDIGFELLRCSTQLSGAARNGYQLNVMPAAEQWRTWLSPSHQRPSARKYSRSTWRLGVTL